MDIGTLLVGMVFLAAGILMSVRSLGLLGRAMASTGQRWKATTGEIIQSEVRRRRKHYDAIVRYRYSVEGREYVSGRISFIDTRWAYPWEWRAERKVKEYPVGRRVTVRFDRHEPGQSVLEPGIRPRLVGHLLVAATIAAAGAGVMWLAF